MYCKNYKTRSKTRKGIKTIYHYCTILKKEITYDFCKGCINKEFKTKNCTKSKDICTKVKTIKTKSNKLAKLERERTSLFTNNLKKCIICGSEYQITKHEIFGGKNRKNSMKYKLVIPLCLSCHEKYQENKKFNDYWHKAGQEKFEELYKSLNFEKIFYRNYK